LTARHLTSGGQWRPPTPLLVAHDFNDSARAVKIDPRTAPVPVLVDLLATNDSRADAKGRHTFELDAYG
jgi:hypothetical protein